MVYSFIFRCYFNYTTIAIEQQKRRSKFKVLGPGAQKTIRFSSRTPRIAFNVLSKTV